MGFFNAGKKAAKFTFISMPMALLGVNQLRMGNQQIKALWQSTFNPSCPECDRGILLIRDRSEHDIEQSAEGNTRVLYPWCCSDPNCGFGFLEEDNIKKVKAGALRYRNERVKASLSDIDYAEIVRISRSHRLHSRAFFVASLVGAIGCFYMLATGAGIMIAINWLSISFALWVFAMKKSYRCWQVMTGQLFVEGAFWAWFQNEKWII